MLSLWNGRCVVVGSGKRNRATRRQNRSAQKIYGRFILGRRDGYGVVAKGRVHAQGTGWRQPPPLQAGTSAGEDNGTGTI
jgi:hypothetical protein